MLNLPVVEVFWITSDKLILVRSLKEVPLDIIKRLIWFSFMFKECFRTKLLFLSESQEELWSLSGFFETM